MLHKWERYVRYSDGTYQLRCSVCYQPGPKVNSQISLDQAAHFSDSRVEDCDEHRVRQVHQS